MRCQSLANFVREAWKVLEPQASYIHGWHIDAICLHLEAVTDGRINRLLINVPPGSMKSLLVSVLWPAWEWGPRGLTSMRYLATAFNDGPVKRDTRKMRDLVLSEWYRTLWPNVELTRTGETSFANSQTGTREGVAFGSLTSQRGDRLIIDDPHSIKTAESEAERNTTVRNFREGATNRLNDQEKSVIVIVMQRLNENDVSGAVLALQMGYVHLCLPMEFEIERACSTVIGFKDPRKTDGELLEPIRFPKPVIDALKRDMGPYAYAGQYQQRPVPREGSYFIRDWFPRFSLNARPANLHLYGTSDYAVTQGGGDWTVHRIWGVDPDGDLWMLDGWRGQTAADVWIERQIDLIEKHKPFAWFGESGVIAKSIEPMLLRRLRERKAACRLEWLPPIGDKPTRARGFQARAAMKRVHLPEGLEGDLVLDEYLHFPAGRHDDDVDNGSLIGRALDQVHPALVKVKTNNPNPSDLGMFAKRDAGPSWKVR